MNHLSFLNPSKMTEIYGERHKEYFEYFCIKSKEFIQNKVIAPSQKASSLSEMMLSYQNMVPTAFVLDFMGNCELKLMHKYLEFIFDLSVSPIVAASKLIEDYPTISPAITSIAGGAADSDVSFIASDIIATRYLIFRHPIVSKDVECTNTKVVNSDEFDFSVETSHYELSICTLRRCRLDSEIYHFISSIDEEMGLTTFYILESANLISNQDGIGAKNLHFVVLLSEELQPLYETPENKQLQRVISATQAIASGKIKASNKTATILDKLTRTKNKKPLFKKLKQTQDRFK
ncbi:hypothetical protein [Vibrio sp. D431a]|uniref:hypothetical protein n=1 Tax=Vibrio sp. D431a TaxID=2837388 RepID=UPI0025563D6C|nr:hypothetical protein [Vibrio sp. D431a]MDK9790694.1 hypothetical protein [Vibrio sp. D431a]